MGASKTRKKLNSKGSRDSGGGSGNLKIPIYLTRAEALDMLDGTLPPPIEGQAYIIDIPGNTKNPNIYTKGIYDSLNTVMTFDKYCEVWENKFGIYVPCFYDVLNDFLQGKLIIWSADLSQVSTDPPFIVNRHIDLFQLIGLSEPTFEYKAKGRYKVIFPINLLGLSNFISYSSILNIINGVVLNTEYDNAFNNKAYINTGKIDSGTLDDNFLSTTYVEVSISL